MVADEKDLTKRIKNSFKAGQSRAEITSKLQKKGLRLEYIDALIKKSRSKKIFVLFTIFILVILGVGYYFFFFIPQKPIMENPLTGKVIFNPSEVNVKQISIDEIEISPEFVSYLLNEAGAWKLHKNYFTGEKAIILSDISGKSFYSEINHEIKTYESKKDGADLQISISKKDVLLSLNSENPREYIEKLAEEGKVAVEIYSSQPELLAKGYFSLHNFLKPN